MGWSGGTEIFDALAPAIWDLALSWASTFELIEKLWDTLESNDWDTQDEIGTRGIPAVAQLYHERRILPFDEDLKPHERDVDYERIYRMRVDCHFDPSEAEYVAEAIERFTSHRDRGLHNFGHSVFDDYNLTHVYSCFGLYDSGQYMTDPPADPHPSEVEQARSDDLDTLAFLYLLKECSEDVLEEASSILWGDVDEE